MKPELTPYKNKKICVAVSGGRDSMALLHYLYNHSSEYGITLSALNCEHGIRGERSAEDSKFVKEWCKQNGVPLLSYSCDCIALAEKLGAGVEEAARIFRRNCYFLASEGLDGNGNKVAEKVDCIATAHHLNDNAETVLFNLARGASLSGLKGIYDNTVTDGEKQVKLIRPLISCTRAEIDEYIRVNGVPFVEDETNRSEDYTRNYIRINVLPALETAVPEAAKAIYRFSRLAADDDDFIRAEMLKRNILTFEGNTALIKICESRALFARAAVGAVKDYFKKKDYTSEQVQALFNLQFAENGKKFEFLNLTAYKEEGRISITESAQTGCLQSQQFLSYFEDNSSIFGGQPLKITQKMPKNGKTEKVLKFDFDAIPKTAVIRFMQSGDTFTKFGGGTKSLGDYFTDKKIPQRLRKNIPLIAVGGNILAVCGVEISEKIKITDCTKVTAYISATDYILRAKG